MCVMCVCDVVSQRKKHSHVDGFAVDDFGFFSRWMDKNASTRSRLCVPPLISMYLACTTNQIELPPDDDCVFGNWVASGACDAACGQTGMQLYTRLAFGDTWCVRAYVCACVFVCVRVRVCLVFVDSILCA